MLRYIIGFFITIGLIIFLIVLLVSGGKGSKPTVPSANKQLYSYYNTDAKARLTIDGLVNYQGVHQQVQITVSRTDVSYDQLQGYDGQVVKHQSSPNTQNAFAVFLHALGHTGFTKGDTSADLKDERGYCPLGQRYVFELVDGSKSVERFWATSCSSTPKTYQGQIDNTIQVFKNQVQNYDDLTQDLNLR